MNIDLVSVTYKSRPCLADPAADILRIVQSSRVRNPRLGMTGILLYNGFHFVQTIEGPRIACNDLFAQISNDPRHSEVVAFEVRQIEQRRFLDWSMRLISRTELREIRPELLNRAIRRGELPERVDHDFALDLLVAPLYWRMVVRGATPSRVNLAMQSRAITAGLKASLNEAVTQ
ncbi:blue-light receptor BLUF domain-containing protein (plasmid) [Cereibacter sphaeroides WS8N]|uniref:BLUF domain-containing protein n=1 Tax=Cereibacter sphaeroides TaxID=1063 RepID=UPI00020B0291|nr:BLUF domain-containing protein [Cereibacter sphaeroides]EGJ19297.1 blue-light receptor BLUF domain-containing protein [Cereibacter sphaeroides WS8N]